MNKTIQLAAKVFAILFILMTSLFALDLEKFSWSGLFMHLLPSLILLVILIISWWREAIGGILWIVAAIVYIVLVWGNVSWQAYLLMSGPALVIGLLFIFSNWQFSSNTSTQSTIKAPDLNSVQEEYKPKSPDIDK